MGLFIVLGGCTFGRYGRKMVGCFCEIEQTESGFCCIVPHEVMGLRNVFLHRRYRLCSRNRRRRRCRARGIEFIVNN